MNPTISVVIPAYNAERYLSAAVESVLSQTFGDFEVILVDDGSADGTLSIAQGLARRDSRLRVISRPNTGLTTALNDGIAASGGRFIARMDADDICMPQRFERQLSFLQSHPEVVAVGGRVAMIDPDGLPIATAFFLRTHEEIDAANLAGRCAMAHPTVMMRRDALERVGGYKFPSPAEDLDLWLRLGEIGTLANLPEVLLLYRQHPASVSLTAGSKAALLFDQVLDQAASRRGLAVRPPAPPYGVFPNRNPRAGWARAALHAKEYRAALRLAVKAICLDCQSANVWATFLLALSGPVGRAVLARRSSK